ncbi:hypothetical protein VTI28DRAFT_6797 [Corynascus sepedonium]
MPLPDFTSTTTFPPFTSLPFTTTASQPVEKQEQQQEEEEYYLLAEIKNNMTLTKPTLICTDSTGATSFAVVFDSRSAVPGPDALDLARLGYKRGATLVLPRARRTLRASSRQEGDGEGGNGFVAVSRADEAGVRVVPARLELLRRVGALLRGKDAKWGDGTAGGRGCESCGRTTRKDGGRGANEEGKGGLMRCTGCGEMEYCCKECQVKGWNEDGHKGDCKAIKAIRAIWP